LAVAVTPDGGGEAETHLHDGLLAAEDERREHENHRYM
jgi:hypothetical protein